ncbi:hypothetical protein GCM10008956_23850 [Deinococcus arenae]|uniref:Outer membrane efflux protein n=1 Tax=Deinococcus arenae TaxID=1452751 RepID=A0A8H9GQN9_9DEIO|nr:TolC family protein [Deinococcus arenae]AWT34926.1 TolC family protein [Deinococcus actinosclerus]GGM46911.1 hypothetical protein GCM10008956_23850 [Deinococcus arenae]
MRRPPPPRLLTLALLLGAAQAQITPPDLTLEQAYAQLAQAPDVTRAALSVQVAQQNLQAARAALGLTVSVSGSASYAGPTTATASDGTGAAVSGSLSGTAGANVSLGLLPWSSAQSSLRASERSLALAQANLRDANLSTRLNVAQAYFSAALATQDITLAGRTLELRQRQLAVAQAQQAAGNATAETVLSAQSAVQAAQNSLTQAQASLDSARRTLDATLGRALGGVTFSARPDETLTLPDLSALVARARATSSDVISAQNALASAQESLEADQRDARLPDLTASVGYGGGTAGTLSATLNLRQGTLGSSYSLPLGDRAGGSASGNRLTASVSGSYVVYSPAQQATLSAAQAGVTQAGLSLTVAGQNAELDVRSRFVTVQTNLGAVQTRAAQVQSAQLAVRTAQARLDAGTGTADDLAAAQLSLAQAERDLLSARITAQLSLTQLLNAAGGPQ